MKLNQYSTSTKFSQKLNVAIFIFIMAFSFQYSVTAQSDVRTELEEIAVIDQKVMMPMRDGIRLCTDIYRPKTDQKVPIIFSRTPYNFNAYGDGEERTRTYQRALEAVKRGYAYVVQNERGRFFSEGVWDILGTPLTDGYDSFSWLEKQSWSNGKIGTQGCSSTAEWQMAVASLDHPAHAAAVAQGFGAGVGKVGNIQEQGNWYRGGAVQMLFIAWLYGTSHDINAPRLPEGLEQKDLLRLQKFYDMAPEYPRIDWSEGLAHLPVRDIIKNANGPESIYENMIAREPNDPAWFEGGLYHDNMPYNKPTYWFVSWYDVSATPNLALYNHMRNNATDQAVRDQQYLVIAPTLHCRYTRATEETIVGERNVGDARLDYDALVYGWFDRLLKDEDNTVIESTPKVQYYTMGSNKWQSSDTWPLTNTTDRTLFLNSNGRANSLFGDGTLELQAPKTNTPDAYYYDPHNPVPSYGGNVCCTGNAVEGGAFDQREMEMRNDILVYSTLPLEKGIEVSGFIESSIYVSSSAKDTDFTIKIIDVAPDGTAYNLDETIQRARYREGYDKAVWMEKDQVYKIDFTPMSTSNYFKAGHKIRIEISSSNFPRFDRNLNTGGENYSESEGVVARNAIYHSEAYPSFIKIPVVR